MNKENQEKALEPEWKALGQVISEVVKERMEKPSCSHIKLKFYQCLRDFYKAVNKKDEKMAKTINEKLINYSKQINLILSGKFNKDVK